MEPSHSKSDSQARWTEKRGAAQLLFTFSFSSPRGCGPGLSEGTGTLKYQGRYLVQNLIVTIHGTTFEAEGVYEFPNTGGILHTTLTGKHRAVSRTGPKALSRARRSM